MEVLYSILFWGSPVGLGLFFFLSCMGAGILFWGIAQLKKASSN
ncbi:hypothetical protein [Pseudoalteromonas shioyasakiensis]|nr:hypothetical protein [Pseudoalteromonas shioyasakiensis]MCZ4252891.1 hypothetical protein [Pseudoalteromonas shioyasakiensis]